MVKMLQEVSDRLLNLAVPSVAAHAAVIRRVCVSCPGAAGYLFRYRWTHPQCSGLAAECTWYGPCGRTCK